MEEISSQKLPFKASLNVLMHKLIENVQLKTYSDVYSSVGNSDPNRRETTLQASWNPLSNQAKRGTRKELCGVKLSSSTEEHCLRSLGHHNWHEFSLFSLCVCSFLRSRGRYAKTQTLFFSLLGVKPPSWSSLIGLYQYSKILKSPCLTRNRNSFHAPVHREPGFSPRHLTPTPPSNALCPPLS